MGLALIIHHFLESVAEVYPILFRELERPNGKQKL